MLEYKDKINISRRDSITGDLTQIYNQILADVQINKQAFWWENSNSLQTSNNSEIADYFVFTKKENNNLRTWDLIDFENYFWENIKLQIISKDLIDFENIEPFIEILCKLI